MTIEFRFLERIYFSLKPKKDCLFSRRNGYMGYSFLGHNLLITKIKRTEK